MGCCSSNENLILQERDEETPREAWLVLNVKNVLSPHILGWEGIFDGHYIITLREIGTVSHILYVEQVIGVTMTFYLETIQNFHKSTVENILLVSLNIYYKAIKWNGQQNWKFRTKNEEVLKIYNSLKELFQLTRFFILLNQ